MKLSKLKKEDLELMPYENIAKLYLEENKVTMNTAELFKKVCSLLELSEEDYQEKITDFFQSLITSKEFILLSDGKWDLKINHKIKIDMDDIYEDKDDEVDEEPEEEPEEDEYNSSIDSDDDYDDDDLSDLTIVDEDDLENE